MTRAFLRYPICRGPLDQSGSGSGHDTTWALAMLQLGVRELQYVLQHIVINKIIVSKKLVLVFSLHFSVALLVQNTTGITTATTMGAAGGNGPLAPHMRPCAPRQRFEWMGDNPLSLRIYCLGGLRVFMALKALLCSGNDASPQYWSVLRAIHTLNSRKNYICLLGGSSPIHSTHLRRAQGLMWGTRGPFLLAAAMVGYGCVGRCWPLEADVRSTYCRNSRNCLWKYFFYSYVDPTYSWHMTWQLKKEDLDLHTLLFR
jgi:hypothetical protein